MNKCCGNCKWYMSYSSTGGVCDFGKGFCDIDSRICGGYIYVGENVGDSAVERMAFLREKRENDKRTDS